MRKNGIYCVLSAIAAITVSFSDFSVKAFLFAAFLLCFCYFKQRSFKYILILLLVCIVFFIRTEWVEHTNVSRLSGNEKILHGVVQNGPLRDGNQAQFDLLTETKEKILITVSLQEYTDSLSLQTLSPGIPCSLQGELIRPSPPTNFNAFDYRHYLKTQYMHWMFEVSSIDDMKCGLDTSGNIFYLLKSWRHNGIQWIDNYFPETLKGIAASLIFGERHLLDADTEAHYQKLGLIHLLAISGLHVGLISMTIYVGLIRLGLTREIVEWILVLLLPMYVVAAGAAPSVIRAASMVILYMLWKKLDIKKSDPFSMLSLFAAFLLFINPYYVFGVGFQLSFLISGALLLSWSTLKNKRKREVTVLVTCIAQLAALPVVLYHFYEFSFLSIVLNLLFIPFISLFVLPSMFFVFVLSFLSPYLFSYVTAPLSFLIEKAHQLLAWTATLNEFQLVFGKPSFVILCCLSLTIFYLFYRIEKDGFQLTLLSPLFLVIFVITVHMSLPYFDENGYVTVLDVGQGDSILIELPYRKEVYLIDGGGVLDYPKADWEIKKDPYDPGDRVVVPFLKAKGIQSINKIIVTHGDVDHYGGLYKTVEEVRVHELIYGKGEDFKEEEIRFLQVFHDDYQIPIKSGQEGGSWQKGESLFEILLPEGNEATGNNRSIVLRAVIGGAEWLFTGDLEEDGEKKLLQHYPELEVDLLKVGHHGSNTSTTKPFIEQLQPKVSFISAGICNQFGHPHEETLQTLAHNGSAIYRTDIGGAIQIMFNQEKLINIKQAKPNLIKESCS